MPELKRTIKCSNCGSEANFYLNTETAINELLMHGKCQRCGNSMQINYSLVDQNQAQSTSSTTTSSSTEQVVNLDETLFGTEEMSSDTLRDIIED
ncbi:hypothetical protein J4450_07840 [Candidatus Micrarchaeota archaeon]|nr:hypothetical protein [Candidatus Micrarchaeota archaeon]